MKEFTMICWKQFFILNKINVLSFIVYLTLKLKPTKILIFLKRGDTPFGIVITHLRPWGHVFWCYNYLSKIFILSSLMGR